MLSKYTEELDVQLDGRPVQLECLHITSYLSGPNRTNTCNAHLGTVYRFLTDLSGKGWQKKHTAFYNLTTHIMEKIVENLDPETGQIHKVYQGKLKIKMLIVLSTSAGLLGNKEYKYVYICTRAQCSNNYHIEIAVENLRFKGYEQFVIKLRRMTRD